MCAKSSLSQAKSSIMITRPPADRPRPGPRCDLRSSAQSKYDCQWTTATRLLWTLLPSTHVIQRALSSLLLATSGVVSYLCAQHVVRLRNLWLPVQGLQLERLPEQGAMLLLLSVLQGAPKER